MGLFDFFKQNDINHGIEQFKNSKGAILLDVRTPEEYSEGHISGTDFNIDVLDDGFEREVLKKIPKGKSVALYCRSGNRSKKAAGILADNGYTVLELSTGFKGWLAAGLSSEK